MKTPFAVISDLHANLEALEAVLADIDAQGLGEIACLGDIVGYGPDPGPVADLVRERATKAVAGNHDWALINRPLGFNPLAKDVIEYTRDMLEPKFYHLFGETRERWAYLEGLPTVLEEGDLAFVHASLRDPLMDYCFGDRHPMWNPKQLEEIFPKVKRICFAGHTHYPAVIRDDAVCWYPKDDAPRFPLEAGRKYIVNVGSVGQPRDGDPRACYAVFEGDAVRYRRVPYDVERTRDKIIAIDAIEVRLGDRLREGK